MNAPTFRLWIECRGAAFDDDPGRELVRILVDLVDALRLVDIGRERLMSRWALNLRDVNGNTVGAARFEEGGQP